MANPTHLKIYFKRTVRVRREHIQGDADDGNNGLMRVVNRGDELKIIAPQARFLIVDETGLEVKTINADAIAADRAELRDLKASEKEAERKQVAAQTDRETLETRIAVLEKELKKKAA